MQYRRIEVRSVGPNERVNLGIELDLVEDGLVHERAIQLPPQDRAEIDHARGSVVKVDPEGARRELLESGNTVDLVSHDSLPQRLDLERPLACLKLFPVSPELLFMQLGPGQHQSLLPTW